MLVKHQSSNGIKLRWSFKTASGLLYQLYKTFSYSMKVQTNARYYTARVVMEYFKHTTNAVLVDRHKLFETCIGHDLYSIFQHLRDKKVTKMCPKYSLTIRTYRLSTEYR